MEDTNYFEYVSVINEIEQLIYRRGAEHITIGGDLNTDFNRQSPHIDALKVLVTEHDMGFYIEMDLANMSYTYICEHTSAMSDIYPIIVSNSLKNKVMLTKWLKLYLILKLNISILLIGMTMYLVDQLGIEQPIMTRIIINSV